MSEENTATPSSERIRVLAIDDNDGCLSLYKDLLEPHGFEVVGIANPLKALERFKTESATFSLVLVDYFMPDLDGEETLELLKRLKPSIKVIIASGVEE